MATLKDKIGATAQALIAAAGMTHAVMATDVRSQASKLHGEYAEYSQSQISKQIADEIKKRHNPGIEGSL